MPPPRAFSCPHCQQAIELPEPVPPGFLNCPACGGPLIIDPGSAPDGSTPTADDELDGLRIRQLSRARRAAFRSRSYALIAAVVCAVAILQLGFLAWRDISGSAGFVRPIAYAILASGAGYGLVHFVGRTRQIGRELQMSVIEPPAAPPDFSALQDGSQRVDQLNQMR